MTAINDINSTSTSSAPSGSNLKEMHTRSTQEKIENITDDLRSRASRIASDAGDRAVHYYDEATSWISSNYPRVLTVVGVVAAIGMAGFFLFKGNRDEFESRDYDDARV